MSHFFGPWARIGGVSGSARGLDRSKTSCHSSYKNNHHCWQFLRRKKPRNRNSHPITFQMAPLAPEQTWVFDRIPGDPAPHNHPRHAARKRSFPPRSFQNDYLQKLNHRGYDPTDDPFSWVGDDITIVDAENDEVPLGFCGALTSHPLPRSIHRFVRRILCDERPAAQILTSPGPAYLPNDSFHENSTILWTNATAREQEDPIGHDSCSTSSSSWSDQDDAREINRRWRRGF